jgi:hypothetical protein
VRIPHSRHRVSLQHKAGHTIIRAKFNHVAADRVDSAGDVVALVQAFHAPFWHLPTAVEGDGLEAADLRGEKSLKVDGLTNHSDCIRRLRLSLSHLQALVLGLGSR